MRINKVLRHGAQTRAALTKIITLKYEDPTGPLDPRQNKIWKHISDLVDNKGYQISIIEEYDCKNLARRDHPAYKRFQTRADGEGAQSGVVEYFENFYYGNEPLEWIPFCIEWDNYIFPLSGNKRMRAQEMAGKQYNMKSLCDVVVITPPVNETEHGVYSVGSTIARISNTRTETTRPTDMNDYAHILRNEYEIRCMDGAPDSEKFKSMTEEEKIEWAKEFTVNKIDNSYGYDSPGKKSALSKLANMAFASSIAPPIDVPSSDKELQDLFNQFWPRAVWESEDDSKVICMKPASGIFVNIEQSVDKKWITSSGPPSKVRKPVFLITKMGKKDMSSVESVRKERARFIKDTHQYNLNERRIWGGFPLFQKVLLVKQLSTDEDRACAYEWNIQTETFDEVERVK